MKAKLVMIAGPYRSGTGDDPRLIADNLKRLEDAARSVWDAGHLPAIGEWFALPLAKAGGSKRIGDEAFVAVQYPVADRLLDSCAAVLRLPGASHGADRDVEEAKRRGLAVAYDLPSLLAALG
jgi:hypothetical protein